MESEQTKSHSELERFHYEAILKNPMYLAEGLVDVLREDLMMNMPIREPEESQRKEFTPRPIVNITYQIKRVEAVRAFKDINGEITKLKLQLQKYFEEKRKPQSKWS